MKSILNRNHNFNHAKIYFNGGHFLNEFFLYLNFCFFEEKEFHGHETT